MSMWRGPRLLRPRKRNGQDPSANDNDGWKVVPRLAVEICSNTCSFSPLRSSGAHVTNLGIPFSWSPLQYPAICIELEKPTHASISGSEPNDAVTLRV
jgi:hypothetical protein